MKFENELELKREKIIQQQWQEIDRLQKELAAAYWIIDRLDEEKKLLHNKLMELWKKKKSIIDESFTEEQQSGQPCLRRAEGSGRQGR
jgi:hypothetical protein